MHKEGGKRWAVGGPTVHGHLDGSRSGVAATLGAAVLGPGPQVEAATNEFVSAVAAAVPGGRLAQHSISSLLVEGHKRCGSKPVVGDARGLVANAMQRS